MRIYTHAHAHILILACYNYNTHTQFIPTENEEISVDRLFSSLIDVGALESENFDIRDEIDDLEDAQTTPPPTKFPPHRVGRQASTIPDGKGRNELYI